MDGVRTGGGDRPVDTSLGGMGGPNIGPAPLGLVKAQKVHLICFKSTLSWDTCLGLFLGCFWVILGMKNTFLSILDSQKWFRWQFRPPEDRLLWGKIASTAVKKSSPQRRTEKHEKWQNFTSKLEIGDFCLRQRAEALRFPKAPLKDILQGAGPKLGPPGRPPLSTKFSKSGFYRF